MADRCRRVVGERETTVNPAGKVVTQAPEPLPARPGSRKLSFVRNQVVICWNTLHLGHAVVQRQSDGLSVSPELLAHISLLGWAHILLTGEYRWPRTVADTPYSVI